ncbi:MAG TPA: histidine kinase [Acidobacteriaceae bacterium]|nr:histidine kinase [Acidobacteriaceae bacterium]
MRSNHQSATNASRWIQPRVSWLLTFLGFTAFGILNFEYRYLDNLARGVHHTFAMRLFEEMTGAYVGLLLFPFVVWAIRRARIRRDNWWVTVPFNFLAMCVFSVADTTGMSVVRRLLAPLFSLGQYDYGIMLYRYPMELAQHVLLFWFAVGAIYAFDSYREARDRQVASADLEARLAEAQLQSLQLQLQPHFLFNALNTISSVMYDDVQRADSMLAQLSDLLRRTLQTGHSQEIPLEEELALVRSYIAIMEERFGDDLQVEFVVDPHVVRALVPQLILQPLVENSMRHARHSEMPKLVLSIAATRENGELLLRIQDNGPGMAVDANDHMVKGIGLSNTEQRLRSLYGTRQQMLLENANGLRVTIRLPLHAEAVST